MDSIWPVAKNFMLIKTIVFLSPILNLSLIIIMPTIIVVILSCRSIWFSCLCLKLWFLNFKIWYAPSEILTLLNTVSFQLMTRSHKEKRSSYAPEKGVRYDGVYRIEKCWRKVGIQVNIFHLPSQNFHEDCFSWTYLLIGIIFV